MTHAECDSEALLRAFAPGSNENKTAMARDLAEVILQWIIPSSPLNLSGAASETGTSSIKTCVFSTRRRSKRQRKRPAFTFQTWRGGAHAETRQVSYIAMSSQSCIHHPLHLAPARMGGEQPHQGQRLWLVLKSMKAAFSPHAIGRCFCFLPLPSEICAAYWAGPSAFAKPHHYTTIAA